MVKSTKVCDRIPQIQAMLDSGGVCYDYTFSSVLTLEQGTLGLYAAYADEYKTEVLNIHNDRVIGNSFGESSKGDEEVKHIDETIAEDPLTNKVRERRFELNDQFQQLKLKTNNKSVSSTEELLILRENVDKMYHEMLEWLNKKKDGTFHKEDDVEGGGGGFEVETKHGRKEVKKLI